MLPTTPSDKLRGNEESCINHDVASKVAIASALVVVISAVALIIILTIANPTANPDAFIAAGGYPLLWSICAVEAASLLIFVTSSTSLVCRGWKASPGKQKTVESDVSDSEVGRKPKVRYTDGSDASSRSSSDYSSEEESETESSTGSSYTSASDEESDTESVSTSRSPSDYSSEEESETEVGSGKRAPQPSRDYIKGKGYEPILSEASSSEKSDADDVSDSSSDESETGSSGRYKRELIDRHPKPIPTPISLPASLTTTPIKKQETTASPVLGSSTANPLPPLPTPQTNTFTPLTPASTVPLSFSFAPPSPLPAPIEGQQSPTTKAFSPLPPFSSISSAPPLPSSSTTTITFETALLAAGLPIPPSIAPATPTTTTQTTYNPQPQQLPPPPPFKLDFTPLNFTAAPPSPSASPQAVRPDSASPTPNTTTASTPLSASSPAGLSSIPTLPPPSKPKSPRTQTTITKKSPPRVPEAPQQPSDKKAIPTSGLLSLKKRPPLSTPAAPTSLTPHSSPFSLTSGSVLPDASPTSLFAFSQPIAEPKTEEVKQDSENKSEEQEALHAKMTAINEILDSNEAPLTPPGLEEEEIDASSLEEVRKQITGELEELNATVSALASANATTPTLEKNTDASSNRAPQPIKEEISTTSLFEGFESLGSFEDSTVDPLEALTRIDSSDVDAYIEGEKALTRQGTPSDASTDSNEREWMNEEEMAELEREIKEAIKDLDTKQPPSEAKTPPASNPSEETVWIPSFDSQGGLKGRWVTREAIEADLREEEEKYQTYARSQNLTDSPSQTEEKPAIPQPQPRKTHKKSHSGLTSAKESNIPKTSLEAEDSAERKPLLRGELKALPPLPIKAAPTPPPAPTVTTTFTPVAAAVEEPIDAKSVTNEPTFYFNPEALSPPPTPIKKEAVEESPSVSSPPPRVELTDSRRVRLREAKALLSSETPRTQKGEREKGKEIDKGSPSEPSRTAPKKGTPVDPAKLIPGLKHSVFPHIFAQLEQLLIASDKAHSVTTAGKTDSVHKKKLSESMKSAQSLFNSMVGDPHVQIPELLRHFGRGKTKESIALRRLVAAFNSGNLEKYEAEKKKYEAVIRGHNLTDVAKALANGKNDNTKILKAFPSLLKNHFCSTDEALRDLGMEILEYIFSKAASGKNSKITNALNALRRLETQALKELESAERKGNSADIKKAKEKIASAIEDFVKLVFNEVAGKDSKNLASWNERLVGQLIQGETLKKMQSLFKMIAHNIRILGLMFDKQKDKSEIFPVLDLTFLTSESSEYVLPNSDQAKLLQLQSEINFARKQSKQEPIALLLLSESNESAVDEIRKTCQAANPRKEAPAIPSQFQSRISAFARRGLKVIAVPISINDHLFKKFKDFDGGWLNTGVSILASSGALSYLQPVLKGPAKAQLMEFLPKLEGEALKAFHTLFDGIFDVMVMPVINGAIVQSKFSAPFQRVINNEGLKLADKLEDLAARLSDTDGLTLESLTEIQEIWTASLKRAALIFSSIAGEYPFDAEIKAEIDVLPKPVKTTKPNFQIKYITPASNDHNQKVTPYKFNKEHLAQLTDYFEDPHARTEFSNNQHILVVLKYLCGDIDDKYFANPSPAALLEILRAATVLRVPRLQLLIQKVLIRHLMQGFEIGMRPTELDAQGWHYLARCLELLTDAPSYQTQLNDEIRNLRQPQKPKAADVTLILVGGDDEVKGRYPFVRSQLLEHAPYFEALEHFRKEEATDEVKVDFSKLPAATLQIMDYLSGNLSDSAINDLESNDILSLLDAASFYGIKRLQLLTQQVLIGRLLQDELSLDMTPLELYRNGWEYLAKCQEQLTKPTPYQMLEVQIERLPLPITVSTPEFTVHYNGERYPIIFARDTLEAVSGFFGKKALHSNEYELKARKLPKEATKMALQYLSGQLQEEEIAKLPPKKVQGLFEAAKSFSMPRLQLVAEQVLINHLLQGNLKLQEDPRALREQGLHFLAQCQEERLFCSTPEPTEKEK